MAINFRWLAFAGFEIRVENKLIYIDPVYWKKYARQIGELTEKADLILVTHIHKDHCQPRTIARVRRPDTRIIAAERCVKEIGGNVESIEPGKEVVFDEIKIKATEAYNQPKPGEKLYHPKGKGVGYLLTLEGKTIYHAGDTDFIPEMRDLGRVDVALLPIGGKFTMDIAEAVEAAITINPEIVIPMHILKADPCEFKRQVERKTNIKVVILGNGQTYQLE